MIQWRLVFPWLRRAWPAWGVLPIIAVHFLVLRYVPASVELINKGVGATLQIAGGTLVLYSINDNLGLFRQQSFFSTIASYFRSFPVKRPPITLPAAGTASSLSGASATLKVGRVTTSLEERVKELERQLNEHIDQNLRDHNRIVEDLSTQRLELEQKINQTSSQVTSLGQRLEHAAVGGFKLQSFGVALAIYGAITSVFA